MEALYNIAQVSNLQTLSLLWFKRWKNLWCSGDPHLFIPANICNSFPTFLISYPAFIFNVQNHTNNQNRKWPKNLINSVADNNLLVFMPPHPTLPIVLMILKDSSNINLPVLSPLNFLTKMVSDFFNFTNK